MPLAEASPEEDADEFEDSEDDLDDEDDEDDEDSDDSMDGAGNAKEFLTKLESDVQADPFNAELHAALISTLREAAKLDQLTKARWRAASQVILPEALWFEWLQDEGRLASDADFEELDALHKTATAACPTSSRIWLSWCNLLRERPGAPAEATRAAFEEALETLGLHPYQGPEIWAEYRDFEESLLASCQEEVARKQQLQRSRSLFLRQLALPMPGLDRLKEAYATFESSLDPKLEDKMAAVKAEAILEESAASWQEREDLERRLQEAGRPMVSLAVAGSVEDKGTPELSAELLALDEASGDSGRIFLGHLRATQWAPGDEGRWRRFADFASNTLKEPRKAVLVLERAVRHCPGASDLWLRLHLEHEAAGSPFREMRKLTELGVTALKRSKPPADERIKDLLVQQADACRRAAAAAATAELAKPCWDEMRRVLEKAVTWLQGQQGGPCCTTLLHWMRLEAYAARSVEATLAVGNRLMDVWGGYYNAWSAFIAAVRYCLGSDAYSTVSKLFSRAIAAVADYPDQVRSDHVQFEQECGTLDSWRAARDAAQSCQQQASISQATQDPIAAQAAQGSDAAHTLEEHEPPVSSSAAPAVPDEVAPASEASASSALAACFDEVFLQDLFKHARAGNTEVLSAMLKKAAASAEALVASEKQGSQDVAQPKKDGTAASPQQDQAPKRQKQANTASIRKKKRLVHLAKQAEAKLATEQAEGENDEEEPGEEEHAGENVEEAKAEEVKHDTKKDAVKEAKAEETSVEEGGLKTGADMEKDALKKSELEEAVAPAAETPQSAIAAPSPQSAIAAPSPPAPRAAPPQNSEPGTGPVAEFKEPQAAEASESRAPMEAARQEAAGSPPAQTSEPRMEAAPEAGVKREAHVGSHYHQKRLKAGNGKAPAPEAEGQQTIYVSNLDWSVDEAQLYRIFADVPGLKEVRLVRDFLKRSKGYAYIDFEKSEQVGLAVDKLNGFVLNKRSMGVARSLPTKPLFEEKTVFVKKLSTEVKEADVKNTFAAKGEIVEVRMPAGSEEGSHKGYAYVEFSTSESATAALDLNGTMLGGQSIEVARSIPMKDHRHQTAAPRKDLPQRSNQRQIIQGRREREDPVQMANKFSTTIYVKNLGFKVDDSALREHFKECGKVQQILICRNAKGASRGFGFVEFENADQAQAALAYNDSVLHGREIWVSKSQRAITAKKQTGSDDTPQEKEQEKREEAKVQVPKAATPAKAKRRLDLSDPPEGPATKAPKMEEAAAANEASKRPFRANKDIVAPAARGTQDSKEEASKAEQLVSDIPVGKMSNADFRALLLKG